MTRIYCRCNSGHYFIGECCPFDGYESRESQEIAAAVQLLSQSDTKPSIAALRDLGLGDATIARAIVVEFGSDEAVFEAIAPQGYAVEGQWRPLVELGWEFH